MPSLGALARIIFNGSLSVTPTSTARFGGTFNITVTNTAAAFVPTSKVQFNGSITGITTTYVNPSTLTAVVSNSLAWVRQTFNLTVSGLGFPAIPFTINEYANNYGEWAPENPTYRQLSGSTYQKLFDLSPYAHDLLTQNGTPTRTTFNGLDWMTGATIADNLESAAGWLANIGFGAVPNNTSQWFYLVASSQASVAEDCIGAYQNRDTNATPDNWGIGLGSSLLTNETFALQKGSTLRVGSTALTWAANTPLIIDTDLGSTITNASLNKNGASVSLTLGTNGNYNPNPVLTHPTTNSLKLLATQRNNLGTRVFPAYMGHNIISYPSPSAAIATEIRRYLASLPTPNIVVP